MNALWFFWGQKHLSFLRWMTLYSASQIHDDVRLVLREEELKPSVSWKEEQDFQTQPKGKNWLPEVDNLSVKKVMLGDIAPDLANLKIPDVQTADLLAYKILGKYGGTVADMDIIFLKPLPQVEQNIQIPIFLGEPKPGYVPVSFLQGKPCAEWQKIYEVALKLYNPDRYESCGSPAITSVIGRLNILKLSEHIVFPWAGEHPWSLWHKWLFMADEWPEIPEDCCGIHWYGGRNQMWNRAIQCREDCTRGAIGWAVREVLGK